MPNSIDDSSDDGATEVSKEQWIAELAVLGQTDRDEYRRIRALAWAIVYAKKRQRIRGGTKSPN